MAHIPGANRLLVSFDERTEMKKDVITSLKFYSDPQYQHELKAFHGKIDKANTFLIIEGNKFWVRFKTSNTTDAFGYKFNVKPLDLRVDDKNALAGSNFEFGCWLADFLFEAINSDVFGSYITLIYDILTEFTNKTSTIRRHRGIELLIRL
eukprot:UN32258